MFNNNIILRLFNIKTFTELVYARITNRIEKDRNSFYNLFFTNFFL